MSGDLQDASEFLLKLWRAQERCAAMPAELRPNTRSEAYAIQAKVEQQSGEPLLAWKIAATSAAGQKHIGVSGPLAGRYIAERVVCTGQAIPFGNNHMKVAEVEFAFRLGRDLSPSSAPYSEAQVMDAVSSLHPAIEIPDSRFDRFETAGEAQLIADNACADWLAIGEAFPDIWRSRDLAAAEPVGRIIGKSEIRGKGSNVLGSPRIAMTWFVNEMTSQGVTLRQGQYVSTGTCVIPMAIATGDHVEGDFGDLGKISVRIGS